MKTAARVALSAFSLAIAAALTLAGCAGRPGLTSGDGDSDGVVYHLPRTLLEITVRQYTALNGEGEAERVWYALGGPDPNPTTPEGAAAAVNSDLNPERAALSRIKSHTMPDPEHRYVINYHPSALSDDRLCISRQSDGLLHDVQFAADDRTPQVVFNIARFIAGFIGGKPAAFDARKLPTKGDPKTLVRSYTNKIDPFNHRDVHAYNNALSEIFDDKVKLDFTKMRRQIAAAMSLDPDACEHGSCPPADWAKRCDEKHICYRTRLSLPVHLRHEGHRIDVKYAEVINAWDIGSISVTRAFLVQKITKLRFQRGALVSAVIRKPSEVEEASLLPVNVMTAVLSVPNGLFNSAFTDYDTKKRVSEALKQATTDLTNFETNYRAALLEGADTIGISNSSGKLQEHYELNCTSGQRSDAINILNPFKGIINQDVN